MCGDGLAGDWPIKKSFFVPALARIDARELARSHGQNAFLWGARDKLARLCWRFSPRR
jgi:hypothetical protein